MVTTTAKHETKDGKERIATNLRVEGTGDEVIAEFLEIIDSFIEITMEKDELLGLYFINDITDILSKHCRLHNGSKGVN